MKKIFAVLVAILLLAIISCSSKGEDNSGGSSSTAEASATIGPAGGTIEVTNTSSPLYGVKVEIPPGALDSDTTVTISQANPDPTVPNTFEKLSKTIVFGPSGTIFNIPVHITIPYNDQSVADEGSPQIYDFNGSSWEGVTFESIDTINKRITGLTLHFSEVAVLSVKTPQPSSFSSAVNGFSIDNPDSKNCAGMVTYALWFYENVSYENVKCSLYDAYDTASATQVAQQAQEAVKDYNYLQSSFLNPNTPTRTFTQLNENLKIGPVILGIVEEQGENITGHAVLVYGSEDNLGNYALYDPDNNGQEKSIKWTGDSFWPYINKVGYNEYEYVVTSQLYNATTKDKMQNIFDSVPFYIGGNWTVTEQIKGGTITWQGQSSAIDPSTATSTLNIEQESKSDSVKWTSDINQHPMTGTITGNKIIISGEVAILQIPSGATVTSNIYNGTGTICGKNIQISGTGTVTGTYEGSGFTITITDEIDFKR